MAHFTTLPERIEETESKAEDITEDITEYITKDRAEDITEVISEDKTEHENTKKRTTDRTFERPENQTDERTEDTSSQEEIHDDENVSEDSTGSTAQTIRVDENNQIGNLEMNLPFGKFGKSFIVIIVFAGIGSLVTIEIYTRTQNRLNVDDPRKFFKMIIPS